MSELHPIIAITGSSGAGTTSVTRTFSNMFRREQVNAAIIEGDSFHRFDRKAMREAVAKADAQPSSHFSHFGHEANLFEDLEKLFADYAATGRGKRKVEASAKTRIELTAWNPMAIQCQIAGLAPAIAPVVRRVTFVSGR